jgi:hypothetical protein
MKISRRLVIFIFFLLVVLFVALLNWPVVVSEIIEPFSLVAWLLLRIFVLSIDQQYYWIGLILAVSIFAIRFLPKESNIVEQTESNRPNETLNSIAHWRSLYLPNDSNTYGKFREREYARMLLSLYAAKMHVASDFMLYDALRKGSIPIPENIRLYLFPEEPKKERKTIRTFVLSIIDIPKAWLRRSTGQEEAAKNRMVEDVLAFFEFSLEMNDYE